MPGAIPSSYRPLRKPPQFPNTVSSNGDWSAARAMAGKTTAITASSASLTVMLIGRIRGRTASRQPIGWTGFECGGRSWISPPQLFCRGPNVCMFEIEFDLLETMALGLRHHDANEGQRAETENCVYQERPGISGDDDQIEKGRRHDQVEDPIGHGREAHRP